MIDLSIFRIGLGDTGSIDFDTIRLLFERNIEVSITERLLL